MDLLRSYGEYDIYGDEDEDEPSSHQRLLPAKSLAPSLDDTSLALSCATSNRTLALPIDPTQDSVVSTPRICGGDKSQVRRTMETELRGGSSHLLIPNRKRQPTPLVGRRGFFWDLDGIKPEGKVLWKLWLSFGERCPKVFNTYYTINEYEVQECAGAGEVYQDVEDEDEEVDLDIEDEKCVSGFHNVSAVDITCCPTKKKFNYLLLDLLKFIRTIPPPATIVFVSNNAGFAPFLRMVKENGYLVIVISESECACIAFQDDGLTLYDWIPAIHGKGFFPSE